MVEGKNCIDVRVVSAQRVGLMIVVFGSVNADFVVKVPSLPLPGETVLGTGHTVGPGGKGANQALSARRALDKVGAATEVTFVGAVGRDELAEVALSQLIAHGVNLSVARFADTPTGAAFISVDDKGENCIALSPGTNALVAADQLDGLDLSADTLLICQREVPMGQIAVALDKVKAVGGTTVFNVAPAGALEEDVLKLVDHLVVNEIELNEIGARFDLSGSPQVLGEALARLSGGKVVVTLGSAGAIGSDSQGTIVVETVPVAVVDTTGAGDAFVGAYAAAVRRGLSYKEALETGVLAGSEACTWMGAQPPMSD